VEKLSGVSKGKAIGHFGNCPYPSAAEVVCHLTLKEVAGFIMVLKVMCSDRTIIKVFLHHHHSSLFLIIKYEENSVLLKIFFTLSIKAHSHLS
jgi:hypothetical protein